MKKYNKYHLEAIFDLILLIMIIILSFIIFLRLSVTTMLVGSLLIAFGYRFQFDRKIIKAKNDNFEEDEDISRKLYFFNFFSFVFMIIGLIVFGIGFGINYELNSIFIEAFLFLNISFIESKTSFIESNILNNLLMEIYLLFLIYFLLNNYHDFLLLLF